MKGEILYLLPVVFMAGIMLAVLTWQ